MRGMIVHLPLSSLAGRTGEEIGVSDWLVVSQARIDQFAEATGDHQWVHQDAARAALESPCGTTIAHGFLTLSLATTLLARTVAVDEARMIINYGCDRVRFVSAYWPARGCAGDSPSRPLRTRATACRSPGVS